MLYSCSVPKNQIYHFFVNRNEFIVSYCLRQYLGLDARCHRHDFLPMMNNLFAKFQKIAIKIKKVAIVITLKEDSATDRREERFWNTVPLKSKLTVPRASILDSLEYRGSRIESRVLSCESRKLMSLSLD